MLDAVAETAVVAIFWPLVWPLCLRNRVPLAESATGSAEGGASGDDVVWSYATCSSGRTPTSCRAAVTTHYSAAGYSTSSSAPPQRGARLLQVSHSLSRYAFHSHENFRRSVTLVLDARNQKLPEITLL